MEFLITTATEFLGAVALAFGAVFIVMVIAVILREL